MASILDLSAAEAAAGRLADAIEAGGIALAAAVWTENDYGHGRLYVVPDKPRRGRDLEAIHYRVGSLIQGLSASDPVARAVDVIVVHDHHAIIDSLRGQSLSQREMPFLVRGSYGGGTYLDRAVVYRWTLD